MRRGVRWLLWIVFGPVVLLLLLALAWLAFNGPWADAAPQPVPPELQPQAVTLAPADNAFFDVQGLLAPAGETPNAWGQLSWRGELKGEPALLAVPAGADWDCHPGKADCVAQWRASAASLTKKMADARLFGERCEALAARPELQEPLPTTEVLPQFLGFSHCLRWLQIDAVLAPDTQQARQFWAQADALLRLMASGTQTLIGQAVTWAGFTRHQILLAQWVARQPAAGVLDEGWLEPVPARLLQPQLWMAAEASFHRVTAATLATAPEKNMFNKEPTAPPQAWAGRGSLGYLPELTMQAMAAFWLADTRAYGQLQGPQLASQARSRSRSKEAEAPSWWDHLRWRNTVGNILVQVGRPHYESYALRQADLAVQQTALRLSQQLNAVPAAERAAWWAQQPLDSGIRERLSLAEDALLLRTWRGEIEEAYKAPLRFPLRPS